MLRDTGKIVITTPNRCIRLEPDMKPWNPFHIRDNETAELEEVLRAVFPIVSVEGLFAESELYNIGRNRVGRAKAAAGRQKGHTYRSIRSVTNATRAAIIGRVKILLPNGISRRLRTTSVCDSVTHKKEDGEHADLEKFIARFSLSDFYYRIENIDEALNLIAICSITESS